MKIASIALTLFVALGAAGANAAEHVVRMVNEGPNGESMAFDPAFLRIAPGDTVVFEPADKGHAVASEIAPAGAQGWEGGINEETRVTLTAPGVYLYRCKPHFALGMIGMIVVGSAAPNRAAVEAFKPRGSLMRARFEGLLQQLD